MIVTLYVPEATELNTVLDWYVVPLILYVSPELPVGVTVIVPVATVHVGCVTLAVGALAGAGAAFIITIAGALEQPAVFLVVRL